MYIYVPTLGRVHRQIFFDSMKGAWKDATFLVCNPNERDQLEELYPGHVMAMPFKPASIGETRQWIMDNAHDPYVLMVDDDVLIHKRFGKRWNHKTPVPLETPEEWNEFFDTMAGELTEGRCVSIATTQYSLRVQTKDFVDGAHGRDLFGYPVDMLRKHRIRYDMIPVMEHKFVFICLALEGVMMRNYFKWATMDKTDTTIENPGGCLGYRDLQMEHNAVMELQMRFPHIVRINKERTKLGALKGTRWLPQVSMKKIKKALREKAKQ